MYYIKSNDKIVKSYPYKLQCICWLFIHGWVCAGYAGCLYTAGYVQDMMILDTTEKDIS